jgi:dolichyl-phosphate beta-glucosyltransferase
VLWYEASRYFRLWSSVPSNGVPALDSGIELMLVLKVRYGESRLAKNSKSRDTREVFVVVPCFNEESRLRPELFYEFSLANPDYRFIFVNDGSSDRTGEILHELEARAPERLRVMDLEANAGKAEAVRLGILNALERNPFAVAFWDADLATPLGELPSFLDILYDRPSVELVAGSRVKLMGRTIERKMTRHLSGRIFATMASLTLNLPFYDTQCGAKMLRVTERTSLLFSQPFGSRWLFDVEICARLVRAKGRDATEASIVEYPVREWLDVDGSKLSYWDFLRAVRELGEIYRKYPELRGS